MYLAYSSSIVPPFSANISGSSRIVYMSKLTLTCSASGRVDSYRWYRNGSVLITTVGPYVKSPAQLRDSGSYQCEACNHWAGCSPRSSSYTVRVAGVFTCMNCILCIFAAVFMSGMYVHIRTSHLEHILQFGTYWSI